MTRPISNSDRAGHRAGGHIIVLVFFGFLLSVILRTAWVADDAYVDLRTAVNAASGFGLRWNVDERVLTFTDPAWVLLLSAVSVFTQNSYLTLLILNLVLSAVATGWFATRVAVDTAAAALGLSVLIFSKAFVEYATSGLRLPLAYVLLVSFAVTYWRVADERFRTARACAIAAICLLTDPMSALLVAPALGMLLFRSHRSRVVQLLPAIAVLGAWTLFATVYFGSPLPMPAVAAWHSGWAIDARASQGVAYLLDTADRDPLTLVIISSGLAVLVVRRLAPVRPLAWGLLLYCVALVVSGGDSLSGRALAPAVLVATIMFGRLPCNSIGAAFPAVVAIVWILGLVSPFSPVRTDVHYGLNQSDPLPAPWPGAAPTVSPQRAMIRDERWLTYRESGLLTAQRGVPLPDTRAIEQEVEHVLARNERVVVTDRIGLFAFVSGTRLHVVDPLGRTDPLLARLPPADCCTPRGAPRAIPDGYVETLETGRTVISDRQLAEMYGRLATLSKRSCFDKARLSALIR